MFATLPLLGWWACGLFDLDEGFYGAVTAEMNRRGEWITPFYNGHPWFEKPILLYWIAKPCLAVFGTALGPRLPSVLATLGTYVWTAWFVKRHSGDRPAQISVLVLASSLLVVALGRLMMTDPILVFCLTGAMFLFSESISTSVPREGGGWRILCAGLIGLGILAKGPVAAILFLLTAGWTYWREPALRPNFRGGWLAGVALLALVVATWYVPAYLVNGRLFVDKFLIEQNIGRFSGGDAAHTLGPASLPFYLPVLFVGMLPWSVWIYAAWPRRADRSDDPTAARSRYLATWAAVVFIFFSLSGAKLPHYILPAIPPLAILVATTLESRIWAFRLGLALCAGMCILANGALAYWYRASGQQEAHALTRYLARQGGDVALYQLGRQEKARGTGGTTIQETDLPSLLLYLNRDAMDTGQFSDLMSHRGPLWVFSRTGRIGPADFAAAKLAGRQLVEVVPPLATNHYRIYELR